MVVKTVPLLHPIKWIKEAFQIYRKHPFQLWFFGILVFLVSLLVTLGVPYMGGLVGNVVFFILTLVFFANCKAIKFGQSFSAKEHFQPFKRPSLYLELMGLSLINILGFFLVIIAIFFMDVALGLTYKDLLSLMQIVNSGTYYLLPDSFVSILLGNALLFIAYFVLSLSATLFAPPLMAFRNQNSLQAMKYSFLAQLKNIGPFCIYGLLIVSLALVVGGIPWLLLWLLVPETIVSDKLQSLMVLSTGFAGLSIGLILILPFISVTQWICFEDLFDEQAPIATIEPSPITSEIE